MSWHRDAQELPSAENWRRKEAGLRKRKNLSLKQAEEPARDNRQKTESHAHRTTQWWEAQRQSLATPVVPLGQTHALLFPRSPISAIITRAGRPLSGAVSLLRKALSVALMNGTVVKRKA